jgi:hypothetical protein
MDQCVTNQMNEALCADMTEEEIKKGSIPYWTT